MAPLQSTANSRPVRLLLLPPPPSEITLGTFRAAYGPALNQVIADVSSSSRQLQVPVVYVAILLEQRTATYEGARGATYGACQGILARFYRLLAVLMAEKTTTDQGAEDQIEFRVLLVASDVKDLDSEAQSDDHPMLEGPFIDLHTLARCSRPWQQVYSTESEAGEKFLQQFSHLFDHFESSQARSERKSFKVLKVAGGTATKTSARGKDESQTSANRRHFSVAVGGTFDHLHIGHKLLLSATAFLVQPSTPGSDQGRCLTVGITGDELLKNKKYAHALESWDERQAAVYDFLSSVMEFEHNSEFASVKSLFNEAEGGREVQYRLQSGLLIKCVEISNPFGPTITDEAISALVVSGETRSGGSAVNDKRSALGWAALEVFEVDVLDASAGEDLDAAGTQSFQSKISSTEIRKRMQQKKSAAAL